MRGSSPAPRSSRALLAGVAIAFAIVGSGCQQASTTTSAPVATPTQGASTATDTQAPTKEPTPSPTATATVLASDPGNDVVGHFFVNHVFIDNGRPWVRGEADLTFPTLGKVQVSAKKLFPGREITGQVYTSIGSAARPLIGAVIEYRQPATGLDEQKYKTDVVAVDPVNLSVLKDTEVQSLDTSTSNDTPLSGSMSNVMAVSLPSGEDGITRGYDALTGARVWERGGTFYQAALGTVAMWSDGNGTYMNQSCAKATGVDVATGRDVFTVQTVDVWPEWCTEARGSTELGSLLRFSGKTAPRYVDFQTGTVVKAAGKPLMVDPERRFIVTDVDGAIQVAELATGTVKWQLGKDKASKLQARALGFYNGKLYLQTTDQSPVVDVATGKTIVNVAARYPIAVIDDWVVFSDRAVEPASMAKGEPTAATPSAGATPGSTSSSGWSTLSPSGG